MKIYGLQKTTLLDYPEHLAAIVFTGGCNFRCPFCHNSELVLNPGSQSALDFDEVMGYIKKRSSMLEGVVISGGEPTLSYGLREFILQIKELGLLVKLDTNGTSPAILRALLGEGIIDYVAMDIKSSLNNYAQVCGLECMDMGPVMESVDILRESSVEYEFRTTIVKEFHSDKTFEAIGHWLCGPSDYYLQSYRDSDSVICPGLTGVTPDEMRHFREILLPYLPNTHLRGVDLEEDI